MQAATSDLAHDLGVYVHVPFCAYVCPYCDFAVEAVGTLAGAREQAFVGALLAELERVREALPELDGRPLATLYIGGGTPSLLHEETVARVVEAFRSAFPGEPREVTLELNPDSPGRVERFASVGVTRLSIGVQSFDDETLRRLGRGHVSKAARTAVEAALPAYASISADLIYGAPGQTDAALERDLDLLLELGVPHVSAYALTIEDGTPFARRASAGQLPLPDEDRVVRMANRVRARLRSGGVLQYEISSYASPGHRARHNQRYWLREDVLGLGPSAASLVGDRRFQNVRGLGSWSEALAAGGRALAEDARLTTAEARAETFALGLRRLAGVSRAAYRRRFGASPERHFPAELRELRELGLVEDLAGRIQLTERGLRFADEAFLRFVGVDRGAPRAS